MQRAFSIVLSAGLALGAPAAASAKDKQGPKKRIAVLDFEDKSGHNYHWENIGTGMAEMLTTALFKTGKFIVIERAQLEKVMQEQQLGASGAVTPGTAAQLGKLIGVGFIVTGAVTEFGMKESKLGVGNLSRLAGLPGGGAGIQSQKARVGLDMRFIDTTTAQIIAAEKAEGESTSRSVQADVDILPSLEFGKEGFDSTVLGKATREAVEDAVELIEKNMESVPWFGRIVKVSGAKIMINTGQEDGRDAGDEFTVERAGEAMTDPDTGESLGSEVEQVGRIKIVAVKGKKLSEAAAVDGSAFQEGDMIKEAD